MNHPNIIVFCGPSGSGKTSIVKSLLTEIDELAFSISATTRNKRINEVHGKDYYFMTNEEFRSKIDQAAFIEFEEVYTNIFYGTLWTEIERIIKSGKTPVLDIDVYGALSIKKKYEEAAHVIFVHPGNQEILNNRLSQRNTENQENLAKRLTKAVQELTFANKFDHIIYNDKSLDKAIEASRKVIKGLIKQRK